MNNNIHLKNKNLWYDIDENGYIKDCLKYQSAVYIFMNICNERDCYIGSSIRLANRINYHRSRINNWNKDYYNNNGSLFYNSVKKYGWNNFKFSVLEYINWSKNENISDNKKILLQREQYYLDIINPSLNICKIAGSPLGIKHGASFSKNLSKARRGKKNKVNPEKKLIIHLKY